MKGYKNQLNYGFRKGEAIGRARAERVIENDLQCIYSMWIIELHERGLSSEQIEDILISVQDRWIAWAASARAETPVKMAERITGIQLLTGEVR